MMIGVLKHKGFSTRRSRLSEIGFNQSSERAEHRRLAAAVRAEEHEERAFGHAEGGAAKGANGGCAAGKADRDVFDFNAPW